MLFVWIVKMMGREDGRGQESISSDECGAEEAVSEEEGRSRRKCNKDLVLVRF